MEQVIGSRNVVDEMELYCTCKDYLVSGEEFKLYKDLSKDMLVTSPQPNSSEIGKYYESDDYISHAGLPKTFFEKLYAAIRAYMLEKKWMMVGKTLKKPSTALDIGCGTGTFIKRGVELGWQCDGVEVSDKARNIAQEATGVNIQASLDSEYFKDKSYKLISLWHVLEHLPNTDEMFDSFEKMLDNDGILLIAVPNFKSYDARHYGNNWAAFDVPRHLYHFSQHSIQKIASSHNFELVSRYPLPFDSFYVSLLSEQILHQKKNYIKAFWIGLKSNFIAWYKGDYEYSSLVYILKKKK